MRKLRKLPQVVKEVERKVGAAFGFLEDVKELRIWKGKNVIAKDEWLAFNKRRKDGLQKALRTFPDDYVGYSGIDDEKWSKDYIELMEKTKNPNYGKMLCSNCFLNPEMSDKYGIKRVLLHIFEDHERPADPCSIVNMFECPYPQKSEDMCSFTLLTYLKLICDAVDDAIARALYLTNHEYKEYNVDFANGRIHTIDYYGGQSWGGDVEWELERSSSDVPMHNKHDLLEILTNREKLVTLLEQKFRSEQGSDEELNAWLRKVIPELFDDIKDKIRREDLKEIDVDKEMEDGMKRIERYLTIRARKGSCMYCNSAANIFDTNCNKWLCRNHWREHQTTVHSKKEN